MFNNATKPKLTLIKSDIKHILIEQEKSKFLYDEGFKQRFIEYCDEQIQQKKVSKKDCDAMIKKFNDKTITQDDYDSFISKIYLR